MRSKSYVQISNWNEPDKLNKASQLTEKRYTEETFQYLTHLLPPHPDVFRYIFTNNIFKNPESYCNCLKVLAQLSSELEKIVFFL